MKDRSERQLFAYFAEEVLAAETTATRAALRVAAALPWLTPNLATHLGLGEEGARLADPVRTSIMITPVADVPGAVAVTPLVRQLLGVDQATTLDVSIGTAAARWYEEHGAYAAALACLVRLGSGEHLATFLLRHGQVLLATGRGADVLDALGSVGSGSADSEIELAILWAESLQAVGRADEAVARFAAAIPPHGPIPTAVAWRLGSLNYLPRRHRCGERRARTRSARCRQPG